MGANITKNQKEFRGAAHDFEKAIAAWPDRVKRGTPVPPVSSGLRVLADAAHLLADGNSDPRVNQDLEDAVELPACSAGDMPVSNCQAIVDLGKLWLGWIANREVRLADGARMFASFGDTGWPSLVAGRQAMDARRFPQAVEAFHRAVEKFSQRSTVGLAGMFGPHPDLADAWFRLGSAQFEAKDYTSAVISLDHASKLRPEDSRAIFVRARARELLGQSGLADYDLASRTAFANVNAPGAGGQAHLYRGLAYYRRGDYTRAEQEFSSSLNFDSGWAKNDAIAWRHMAAVANGACGTSVAMLRDSLGHVSDYFPMNEATALMRNCPSRSISEIVQPTGR
jgi:tetratricopeptide (TPR) repeat protein